MLDNFRIYLKRARQIYDAEGILPLIRRGFFFAIWSVFSYETFYLVECETKDYLNCSEDDFLPKIDNLCFKIITNYEEADALIADGFELQLNAINIRRRLDKGAVAFCSFVGHELANIGWAAATEEASNATGCPPIGADFSAKEVVAGGDITMLKYRGKGLMKYNLLKKLEYFANKDKAKIVGSIRKNNAPSVSATMKLGYRIWGEGSYLRFLWWKFWKESRF